MGVACRLEFGITTARTPFRNSCFPLSWLDLPPLRDPERLTPNLENHLRSMAEPIMDVHLLGMYCKMVYYRQSAIVLL